MNLRTTWEKFSAFLTRHPARFFLVAALLWIMLMILLDLIFGFDWNGILVEANGMAFDLLVFGILLSVYEVLREKRDKIERLYEEIDDYRGWDEKEATYRIVGAIRRLNKLGKSRLGLNLCFLQNARLSNLNLSGTQMNATNLRGADFHNTNLSWTSIEATTIYKANFREANLTSARMVLASVEANNSDEMFYFPTGNDSIQKLGYGRKDTTVDFEKCNLTKAELHLAKLMGANFKGAILIKAELNGANLSSANFQDADLRNAYFGQMGFGSIQNIEYFKCDLTDVQLEGAFVDLDWFEKLNEWETIGRGAIQEKYEIGENGRLSLKR